MHATGLLFWKIFFFLFKSACIKQISTIRELVSTKDVRGIEQLIDLCTKPGVHMDVETAERHLDELQVRVESNGLYVLPTRDELTRKNDRLALTLQAHALSVHGDVQMMAVSISSGQAKSVAAAIEDGLYRRIIGAVPGKDIVLVLAQSDHFGQKALMEIHNSFLRFHS